MKRVKVTLEKPNPLFELWLEQWKEKAASQGSNLQFHFTKALNALRKYPLSLNSGKECIILKHFGSKLCMMLDKKLAEFKFHQKEVTNSNKICKCNNCSCNELYLLQENKRNQLFNGKIVASKMRQTEARHTKCTLPSWNFTCYAILLTLYGKAEDSSYPGYMHKSELLYESRKLYNKLLQLSDPDVYSERSSIFILISNELICLRQFPIRYHLTKYGTHLAKKINYILNLTSYNKKFFQIYFIELQNSLQTLGCNHVMNKKNLELDEQILLLCSKAGKSPKKINEINLMEEEESNTIFHVLNHGKKHDNNIDLELDEQILHLSSGAGKSPKKISEINLMEEEESNTISYVLDHGKKQGNQNALKQSSHMITNILNEVPGTIQLKPYSFDIILLVDIQETCGGKIKPQDDLTLAELTQLGVPFEVRHLKVGDFTWIAKCKYTKSELVLPYIIERKRLDDLAASIKDGRFHEQKFRLKQSGIQNLFYLVEYYERYSQAAITVPTLLQASINSLVQDGFIVKYTDSHQDSMSYLASLTDMLSRIYMEKNLIECNKENLIPIDCTSKSILLMKFEEFNKASSKLKNFSVCQMFLRQLLQLKGISVSKALAIVQNYPTPQILIKALQKSDCGEKLIAPIQYGLHKRQIGPAISKTVYLFYTQHELK